MAYAHLGSAADIPVADPETLERGGGNMKYKPPYSVVIFYMTISLQVFFTVFHCHLINRGPFWFLHILNEILKYGMNLQF